MNSGHVYTADGQRLYTTAQLAEALGIAPQTVRVRWHRRQIPDPYLYLDGRTPLWTLPKEHHMTLRTYRQPHVHLQWAAKEEAMAARKRHGKFWIDVTSLNKPMTALLADGYIRLVPFEGGGETERHLELTDKGIAALDAELLQQVIDDGNANKRTHGATSQDITAEEVLEFYRSRTEA